MPVSFLSEDQRTRYGHYAGEPTAEQLARCFHLNDADRELIAIRRGDHNRLGFALQLCTVRFLSTFLEDLQSIPAGVVNNVARQLAIDNPSCYAQYCAGEQRWEHAAEIRTRYGYQDFSAGSVQFRLNRWLYALCWTGTDRPSVLFDRATGWLVSQKVLLPGISVLERFVSRLRGRVEERLWHLLISRLTPQSDARLEALLKAVPGERKSQLERLRTGPTRRSAPELIRALGRVDDIRNLAIDVSVSARLPRSRVLELARFAATAKVTAIERMGKERRAATLVALVSTLEATAQDDALDVLDIVLSDIFSEASKAGIKARLRTLKDLDAAAVQDWLKAQEIKTLYIKSGSPWENGHIESFHDKLRDECLNREFFGNLQEARVILESWRVEYDERRPHSSLGYQTPNEYAWRKTNRFDGGYAPPNPAPLAGWRVQRSARPRCFPVSDSGKDSGQKSRRRLYSCQCKL